MSSFYANIVLRVDLFDAIDRADAMRMVDEYVDRLAETSGLLTWTECDADVIDGEEGVI